MAISLGSIKRGVDIKPPRITVFGVPGVGKTTFAVGAPSPILLQAEDGLGKLGADRFPLLTSYNDAIQALTALYSEPHDYKTVVLDSLDFFEPLIWQAVCDSQGIKSIEDIGYGKGYTFAMDYWRKLLKGFDSLRDTRGMAIILIAHSDIKRFDSPLSEPYDRYVLRLHSKAAALINDWSDALLFANYHVAIKATDVGFDKKARRGTSSGERFLYTQESPGYTAKNKYGLPTRIPLDWPNFSGAMTQALTPKFTDKETTNG